MPSTITTLDLSELNRTYADKFVNLLHYSPLEPLIRLFPNKISRGGNNYQFGARVAGNASAGSFSEGDPVQTAGHTVVVQATVPYVQYRAVASITGHARTAAVGAQEAFFIQAELDDCLMALKQNIVTGLLSDSVYGVLGLVDSANALHGLSRTTYPALASVETAGGSATLNMVKMEDTLTGLEKVGANPSCVFMSPSMRQAYVGLVPSGSASIAGANTIALEGGRIVDLGYDRSRAQFSTIPIIAHKDM